MYGKATSAYKRTDLASAPKEEILDRLYGRLLRDLDDAKGAIDARDIAAKAEALGHADRIITELQVALDFNAAPELCENLARLYDYVTDRLITANARLDTTAIDQAAEVVAQVRDAFLTARREAA